MPYPGRRVLAGSLIALLLAAAACAPVAADTPFYETRAKEVTPMQPRMLIAYATRSGGTSDVAKTIGEEWTKLGAAVDVQLVEHVTSVSDYAAVAIGSSIRMGNWLPQAKAFVAKHEAELKQRPVADFLVCLTLKDDTPEKQKEVDAYPNPVRALNPVSEAQFAGKMDYAALGFFERFAVKYMVKAPEGDFRNWDQIRQWARDSHAALTKT